MNANQIERAAYICAHRFMTEDVSHPSMACPGGRRSATIDSLAKIIIEVFSVHNPKLDQCTDWDTTNTERSKNEKRRPISTIKLGS